MRMKLSLTPQIIAGDVKRGWNMRILSLFKYFFAALLSIGLGFADTGTSVKRIVWEASIFLLTEILTFVYFKSGYKRRSGKECVSDLIIPLFLIIFLTSVFNCRYGYGNTFGILGYRKEQGIFTLLGIPIEICGVILLTSYAALWTFLCIKMRLRFRSEKIILLVLAFSGAAALLSCVCLYFLRQYLFDSILLLTLFIYFILYTILKVIIKQGSERCTYDNID